MTAAFILFYPIFLGGLSQMETNTRRNAKRIGHGQRLVEVM